MYPKHQRAPFATHVPFDPLRSSNVLFCGRYILDKLVGEGRWNVNLRLQ